MKSIWSLHSQSRPIYLLMIASLLIQMGFTTPVQATADPAPQASVQSTTFTTCADATGIPQSECEVLVALYNSTGGANWTNHDGWLETNTPCSWFGIRCDAGHVSSIEITTNNLTGPIPTEIGSLSNLTFLELDSNQLSGSIPPELGNLVKLTELRLNYNQLTGDIPATLANLVNLQTLALSRNQLSGPIPPNIGNLTNLREFRLAINQLSGQIPSEIGNLSNLTSLNLDLNQLSGSIPPELGNLVNLTLLRLRYNQLTGEIPATLANLVNLQNLGLSGNQLSGPIPPDIGNLTTLQELGLSGNQLSGNLPSSIGNLTSLTELYTDANQLSGEIPSSIINLAGLTTLTLSCDLTSTDPLVIAYLDEKLPGWQGRCYHPSIGVVYNQDAVAMWEWKVGGEATLTIDDPDNGPGVDYTTSMIIEEPDPVFYVVNQFDIQPGDIVTVTDGIATKTVTVSNVRILGVNPDTDIVYGGADPSDTIWVTAGWGNCEQQTQEVTANQNGNWVADFADICNITDFGIMASELDDGWTRFDFTMPTFTVQPQNNKMYSPGWLLGNEVTLNIDSVSNGTGIDFTVTKTPLPLEWDRNQTYINFDLSTFETHPGDLVTMTDGITTKKAVVTNLVIGDGNITNDRVWGTADRGTVIRVSYRDDYNIFRNETAGTDGNWIADFSVPGDEPGEEALFDIQPENVMLANQTDADGDQTQLEWHAPYPPNPYLDVFVTQDRIEAHDWPLGHALTLTIDRPGTPLAPDYTTTQTVGPDPGNPTKYSTEFDLNGLFHYQVGDLITVSDGVSTKTHTVANVTVTRVDPVAETVSGTADPGAEVAVDIAGGPNTKVTADADGQWSVDFTGMYDLTPNMNGSAQLFDNDGDASRADFPHPQIRASVTEGWQSITASDWPIDTIMTLTIEDPATPQPIDYTAQAAIGHPRDPRETIAYFDLHGVLTLKPGDFITMTDGIITKTHTIAQVKITGFDIQTDQISGIAAPNTQVHMCLMIPDLCISDRYVNTDSSGNWTVNYRVPGIPPDEQEPVDIQPNMEFMASISDEDGDWTEVNWRVPNPNFDVRANSDQVEAFQWNMGSTLTLKIDNPITSNNPDYTTTQAVTGFVPWDPSQTYVLFDLLGTYDIQTGDVVSVTDGSLTKTTMVTNLAITDIHLDTDMVYGIAEPNQTINVWTCWHNTCVNRDETADQVGHWVTNFAVPGEQDWEQDILDVQPGSWIDSSVNDDDGDSTMSGRYVPIDTMPPTITWMGNIHDSDSFSFGFVPSEPTCIASDDISGVDGSCAVTGYASTLGTHTLIATARDNAGNVATETRNYIVSPWTLKGFYQPVDMNGVYNVVKNGSTVPFKFEIFTGTTELTDIVYIKDITYAQTSCNATATTDDIESTSTGGTSLRYDAIAGQFVYNLKMPGIAGKCYRVTMTTVDGSSLVAYFKLR